MGNIIKYPYDPTGKSPTNRIDGIEVNLPRVRNRAFAVDGGLFYAKSLDIVHTATGYKLKPSTDFVCLGQHQEATMKVNQEIASIVYVTNAEYADNFVYGCQLLGGELFTVIAVIEEWIKLLELDGRAVHWDNVLGKPVQMPPTPHLHHVDDLYGFDSLVEQLVILTDMITKGDEAMKAIITDTLARLQETVSGLTTTSQSVEVQLGQIRDRLTTLEQLL